MPTPRPETLVTFSAVENPGRKNEIENLPFAHAGRLFGGNHSALDSFLADPFPAESPAIVR